MAATTRVKRELAGSKRVPVCSELDDELATCSSQETILDRDLARLDFREGNAVQKAIGVK